MKIELIRLVHGQRVEFSRDWNAQERGIDIPGLEFKGSLKIEVSARRDSGIIEAKVHVNAPVEITCARCLDQLDTFCDKSFKLVYSVDLAKEVIILDGDIYQELILSYPQKMLCCVDCRGLCPKCGENLNKNCCVCGKKED